MFPFFITCTVCKGDSREPDRYLLSYYLENEAGRITKACCQHCHEKTHDKWTENGWKLVEKSK